MSSPSFLPAIQSTRLVGTNLDDETEFNRLSPALQGMMTSVVYLSPKGKVFDLAGPRSGRQGVRLQRQLLGDQQWPFTQVISNSPYVMGATVERQNISERRYNIGVIIGSHAPQMTAYQYRMAEANWWASQDETQDGWLGVYTRFSGWRWNPVRPDSTVTTAQPVDPVAFGNNSSAWDITWMATRPYFTKPALYRTWEAKTAGTASPPPGQSSGLLSGLLDTQYYWGSIPLANRGDLPSYVTLFVSSPGQAIVQDNDSTRLVPLPKTSASVGTYMCDTEPSKRTLTAANDPQDNLLFDFIRQSQVLNFLLGGLGNEGLPLQLTWNNRFMYMIPPKTAITLSVGHTNRNGVITAVVPQRWKRSR
jgi:hypothetical protein